MIDPMQRVFRLLDAAGLRRPKAITDDSDHMVRVYAGICRGFSADELKAGAVRWIESGAEWFPTASQLRQSAEQARGRPDLGETLAAIEPEPDILPLADQLRPSDYQAYLDAYADGPDGETGEDVWERMTIWVRDRVQSRGEWKSFR